MPGPTLVPPKPVDASKAPMENVLELTSLSIIAPVSLIIRHMTFWQY